MRKKIYLFIKILIAGFFYTTAFAQATNNAVIKGIVFSEDGKPAPAITVQLQKGKRKTITDKDGNFSLYNLQVINDTLLLTGIGFSPYKKAINFTAAPVFFTDTIRLNYVIAQLQDVEIIGRLAQSYKSDYSFFGNKTETPLKDIPQSISTITKETITDKMEFTLKDAVDEVAGVNQYSGYDDYTIRGFRAENAHNINGLRGYNTTYTSSMLVNIERIEVIKGPTATLYGNCDPGGTINLVTKKPLSTKQTSVDFFAGSWNHYRAQADVTAPINKKKTWLYRLNAGYDNTTSFRSGLYAKSYEFAPSVSFVTNNHWQVNADFSVSHINTVIDRGQPGFLNDTTLRSTPIKRSLIQPGDYLHETDVAAVISASYKVNKNLSISSGLLTYSTWQNVAEHGLNNYITPDSVSLYYTKWNYKTVTSTLTNYATYNFKSGKVAHQLLAGYDFIRSAVNLTQQYYEQPEIFGEGNGIAGTFSLKNPVYADRETNSYKPSSYGNEATDVDESVYHTQGFYMQEQASVNKWKFLLNVREEFYKGGDDDDDSVMGLKQNIFLPRIGLVYALKPNISAYATYNKGFDPFEASSGLQIFNEPFKPVVSRLLEAGMKGNFFKNNLAASLAFYQLTVKNVAVNANDIMNPDLFIQQGENRSRGIEAETAGNVFSNLSITVSYAYCNAKIIQSTIASQIGATAENAPRNASSSWVKYTLAKGFLKGFGITAGHTQQSIRNTLDARIQLPAFCVFNGGLLYGFKQVSFAFNAFNLTNKVYWMSAYNNVNKWPGEPRNCMLHIGYKF